MDQNITVVIFKMKNKLLKIIKNAQSLVILVTDPAEYLQVLLSAVHVGLEVIPDFSSATNTSEVTSLALHPGECGEI